VSAPDRPAPPPPAEPDPERPETPPAGAPVGLAVGTDGRAGGPAPTLPRLRRPSGYPPPLPRAWNGRTVALLVGLALWLIVWIVAYLPVESPPRRADGLLVDLLARDHRTAPTASLARGIDLVDRPTVLSWLALATIAGAAALGRFRRAAVPAGGGLGVLIAMTGFSLLVPDDVFPLTGPRTRSAHLNLDVRRPAIARALAAQLGLRPRELEPFGLAGSGGSSPMRLVVDGHPEPVTLFAKLYAQQHVRADRWYKLGRAMLYGRLEDERPFRTVRRMVQNEDYLLRVMRDAGLPVVRSYGFLELTPEREYVLVTEFATGAREICDEQVAMDLGLIDDGLRVVRGLWDAGIAHRDIKPSNLLVRDGRIVLIDVAFAEQHPSPWRQAVDLADMMLVLALRSDAETVYRRALRFFSPDDLAEAFASCGGVTLPSQLRAMPAADGRDLPGRFRQLAPPRPPVMVQKWSPRRVGLLAGSAVAGLLTVGLVTATLLTADPAQVMSPVCVTSTPVQLFGQAVPRGAYVPCVPRAYTEGIGTRTSTVRNGIAVTYSALPDGGVVTATYTGGCPPAGRELSSSTLPLGTQAWAAGTGRVLVTFPGGCVRFDYQEDELGRAELALPELLDAVRLVPRWRLNAYVLQLTDSRELHL
jgi:tRNA A-37 threonylcarbamoyl transferase component Bud32